uniref:Uncharacterized protein n=1 Tax=viral metagenome TaxID=1070528 RepID=A0A6C0C8P7_9ZZZZ
MDLNYILRHAVRTARTDVSQELIDKGADPCHVDLDHKSALDYAYEFRQKSQIEILCKNKADINKERDGCSIIMSEFTRSIHDDKMTKVLMDNGANPNVLLCGTISILQKVCFGDEKNGTSLLSLLLTYPNTLIDFKDVDGMTALQYASGNNFIKSVKILLKHGANLNVQSDNGSTILMYAISKGHHNMVLLLLSQKNIEINSQDNEGMTALHHACECGNISAVALLILHGADTKIVDNKRFPALHYNKTGGAIECLFNYAAMKEKNEPKEIIIAQTELAKKVLNSNIKLVDPDEVRELYGSHISVMSDYGSPRKICQRVGDKYQTWFRPIGWSDWMPLPPNFKANVEYTDEPMPCHIYRKKNRRIRFNFIVKECGTVSHYRDAYER